MSVLKVNLDLVQKYNVAGPRYTSLSAGDEVHRYDNMAGIGWKNFPKQPNRTRSLALFPHSVLRNALLVLRLRHRHHVQP